MKKLLIAMAVLAGIAFLAKRFAPDLGKRHIRKRAAQWMFANISAIRDNAERIVELLESENAPEQDTQVIEGNTP